MNTKIDFFFVLSSQSVIQVSFVSISYKDRFPSMLMSFVPAFSSIYSIRLRNVRSIYSTTTL